MGRVAARRARGQCATRGVALRRLAQALALVVLAVMAWQGWLAARDTLAFVDVTADLGLPRIPHWIALLRPQGPSCLTPP
jgi:hypothetical protein